MAWVLLAAGVIAVLYLALGDAGEGGRLPGLQPAEDAIAALPREYAAAYERRLAGLPAQLPDNAVAQAISYFPERDRFLASNMGDQSIRVAAWCLAAEGALDCTTGLPAAAGGHDLASGTAMLFTPPPAANAVVVQVFGDEFRTPFPATHGRPTAGGSGLAPVAAAEELEEASDCGGASLVAAPDWAPLRPSTGQVRNVAIRIGGACPPQTRVDVWLLHPRTGNPPLPVGAAAVHGRDVVVPVDVPVTTTWLQAIAVVRPPGDGNGEVYASWAVPLQLAES